MYVMSCITFVLTLCILAFVLRKIYKINNMKQNMGQLVATYPRMKWRWLALLGPTYFIGQLIFTYIQYINGDIDTFEKFLIKAGIYTVTSCFMILLVIQLIKNVEVYEKGIVDGFNFYSYEELKGYKISTWENPKENIFLYRGQEKWQDNVNLFIKQEDMSELENILQRYIPKLIMK